MRPSWLRKMFRLKDKKVHCPWCLLLLLLAIGLIYISYSNRYDDSTHHPLVKVKTVKGELKLNGSQTLEVVACPIPQLDPFDKSIRHLLNKAKAPSPAINCQVKYPRLFRSTWDSRIIPWEEEEEEGADSSPINKAGYVSCCYRTVKRNGRAFVPDDFQILSRKCFPLSTTNSTKIPEAHEFIAVYCKNKRQIWKRPFPLDVHAFVPLKEKPEVNDLMMTNKESRFNVVIFGVDAMSRMSFLRTMSQSYAFLKKEMEAVEMTGYNKVGVNTLPNLIPMLTSSPISELGCLSTGPTKSGYDQCPFIWKRFEEEGYYTSFNEDSPSISIFNFRKPGQSAFRSQPTDHYLRPLALWASGHVSSKDSYCYGPRLSFQFLLDYMQKYVERMSQAKENFFQLTWATALTHSTQNTGGVGDAHLLNSLRWLKSSGYLNQTVFILMSDHGIRFGKLRNTVQGQLEDRLPFMFLIFPESFKKTYSQAYRNLLSNRDKLMTTFDVHETLLDILFPDSIEESSLKSRDLAEDADFLPRGLSLFLPIPKSRTCEMAGIPVNFCSCLKQTSVDSPVLLEVAKAAVLHINHLLKGHPKCSHLQYRNLTLAQQVGWEADDHSSSKTYIINFITEPGGAAFEAMVGGGNGNGPDGNWTVQGIVERTNWYGNQSRCADEPSIKQYCHCAV